MQRLVAKKQTSMRWDDARIFLAIWREGSLKRAAATLRVNISTISRRLETLEQTLNTPLFDRASDGTLPTAAAAALFPFAESMEQAALGFMHRLADFDQEPKGVVRITAPPGVVDTFIARDIPDLLEQYPKIRLEVSASIEYLDLTRRQADIALRARRPDAGDLVAKRLAAVKWCVLGSSAGAKKLSVLRDPRAHPWLTWDQSLSHLADTQWLVDRIDPERIVVRSNNMSTLLSAARSGLGLLIAPLPYATLDGLEAIQCSREIGQSLEKLPPSEMWIVGHRAHRHVPRIQAVWTWLEESFRAV